MKFNLLFLAAFLFSLPIFATKNELASPKKVQFALNDTIFFDLDQALITTTTGNSFIDIPVYMKATDPVNSFDFWFKFDETKLTYFSTISALSALDTYSNFNQNDRFLRNTTSGPSSSYQIANNTTLIYVRFQLKSSCTQVFTTDFTNVTALTNGQICRTKFISSTQNPTNLDIATGLICSGTTTGFTFPATVAGRTISDYNWNFGNGVTSKLQNPFVKFDSPGNFAISLFIQTNEGCSYTINKNIVVNETPKAKFTYKIDCVKDSVEFLKTRDDYDLIILDIHLSDGNSFEIFNQIEVKKPIIFITAYDEYAVRAFKQLSMDYLLKIMVYKKKAFIYLKD